MFSGDKVSKKKSIYQMNFTSFLPQKCICNVLTIIAISLDCFRVFFCKFVNFFIGVKFY